MHFFFFFGSCPFVFLLSSLWALFLLLLLLCLFPIFPRLLNERTPAGLSRLAPRRLYCLHEVVQHQERQRREGLVRKLSKCSGLGFGQCVRSRSKARKVGSVGAKRGTRARTSLKFRRTHRRRQGSPSVAYKHAFKYPSCTNKSRCWPRLLDVDF